jgi:uncharacterized membrane protein
LKRRTKIFFLLVIVFIITVAILLIYSTSELDRKHKDEIHRVIQSIGGEVVKIETVDREKSPFVNESNKRNIIYRVEYTKSGENQIAWYRGVNIVNDIHYKPVDGGYGEKWISNTD